MKVLALNGSPRMRSSSTYHMLAPLLEGMEAAGAETTLIHLRKLDLKACIGCYTCWVRTPGKCIFHDKDKMLSALQAYNEADLVIFGTPLYHYSMTGIMKDFIDRTLVRIEPWLIPHPDIPDTTFHPERFHKPEKMMLVSPCGFPEFEHFDSLVATFRQMAKMERMEFVGEILRPAAETLSRKTHQGLFGAYYERLRRAGSEIVNEGSISDSLQEALRQDLFPGGKQVFYGLAENYWTEQMDRHKVPEEQRHTVPILASDLDSVAYVPDVGAATPSTVARETVFATNDQLMQYLASMFNPAAVPELRATIQFVFSPLDDGSFDPGPARWYMNIAEGKCTVLEGATAIPTLTISTPNEVWQRIGSGQINAEVAFTDGDFEAEGSMTVMALFPQIFQYPQPAAETSATEAGATVLGMPNSFNAEAAGALEASIEFVLGGAGGGIFHLRISKGKCTSHTGAAEAATLTINAPADIWAAISAGELDGQQAFMAGDYRANGDMAILMKLDDLFPTPSRNEGALTASVEEVKPTAGTASEQRSFRDTIAGMVNVFDPQIAGDMTADIQFEASGEEPGSYCLRIINGECEFVDGVSEDPALTIKTPSEVWLAISRGEIQGQAAFMEQKYIADGDFSILMKMSELFKT